MATEKRLIDANEVLQRNEEAFEEANKKPAENFVSVIQYHTVKEMVNSSPTLDAVEVVHGWWIELPSMEPDYKCSECGQSYAWWEPSEAHYCPNCGAKMDGGKADV